MPSRRAWLIFITLMGIGAVANLLVLVVGSSIALRLVAVVATLAALVVLFRDLARRPGRR